MAAYAGINFPSCKSDVTDYCFDRLCTRHDAYAARARLREDVFVDEDVTSSKSEEK